MRFSGGLAGVAAAVLIIGVTAIPAARAAGDAVGAATATAPGTTLYVDFNGTCSDSGPGTQADPLCTVQAAANVVDPGQTVAITAASTLASPQSVTITRSGTPTEPITFAWAGTGIDPAISPGKQTGKAVVTLQDVHDVTLSHLTIGSVGTDDAVDVIGSSDISLANLGISHESTTTTATPESDDIMIDGASANVTVSRTEFLSEAFQAAVLAQPGAQQVTLTTNLVYSPSAQSGFVLDGTAGAAVTSNTVMVDCSPLTVAHTAITLADSSSGTVENNVIEPLAGAACPTPTVGLSVDASSADSAGGVTADYNGFYSEGPVSDYSWAGASYQAPAAFSSATGQGAHDVTLPAGIYTTPPEGSPVLNSANCSAPGELSSDFRGQPWLRDPLATDADLGSGSCYASRGAFTREDAMPVTASAPALNSAGYAAGAVPFTSGVTTGAATSGWGEPVSYTVNFGDGSAAVSGAPATLVPHTYPTPGQYTVTVTATDTSGTTAIATYQVYALPDQGPTAGLSAAPDGLGSSPGITPDTADFTASTGVPTWGIASSAISYGGSGRASNPDDPNVTWEYTYAEPGTYTATATVTDKLGRTSTAKATITVGDEPQDVFPKVEYSHSVAAHATVKIPLLTLEEGGGATRGALIDVRVTSPQKAGYVIVYPNGTTRPDLSTVQFQAGRAAENSTLATGSTVDFYNGSAGTINLEVVTYGVDTITTTDGYGGYGGYGETYSPVTPVTVLPKTEVAGDRQLTFAVAGTHGVPADAQDVVLDVTASGGTTAGSFATYGTGGWGSEAADTDGYWDKEQQVTNLDMVPLNGGKVVLENAGAGAAYFTAEVVGYYLYTGSDAVFLPATPRRLGTVTIAANRSVALTVSGKNGIPATGTTGVALDLTASEAAASGTLAAYADGTPLPFLISLSYARGIPVANAAIVAVGKDGAIRLYNSGSKPVAVNVDLTGSYYAYP